MANGFQDFLNNPLVMLGANMMRAADPRMEGLGGLGAGLSATGETMRQRAQLAEENERARMLADLQARQYEEKLAQQGQPDLSKSPVYIRNPQTGATEIIQLSATGETFKPQLPEGYEPALPLSFQDVGTHLLGFQRGAQTPSVAIEQGLSPEAQPATRAAQTAATERARATQTAKEEWPLIQESTNRTIGYIDQLMEHPGLEAGTGFSAVLPVIPGSERADFEARKAQLVGGAFLQAYQELKGGGQITEIEGQKAEASLARMQASTSAEDFREALEDFRSIVTAAQERARKRAGVETPKAVGETQSGGNVVDWSEL